jgi:hypothetical protein
VRHPYDRIRSYYCFLKAYWTRYWEQELSDVTFHDFVFDTPPEIAIQVGWYSQTQFLYYNQELAVDRVIRFESFVQEFKQVFAERGLTFDMRLHELPTDSDQLPLTEDIKACLFERYRDDFDNFGFER